MKISILGGGGCFALNFARFLWLKGIDHFGIGRSGPKIPAFWLAPANYRFWPLHLVDDLSATLEVLDDESPDIIVNFAAQGEGAASFGDNAPDFFRTNTWGLSRLVIELGKRKYLKRFINIGTSELYGSTEHPARESDALKPSSPYAISKAAFDQYLISVHRHNGFPMNIIRPSNCYTPGQQLYRIIPKTIISGLSGKRFELHGGGKAEKSYLDATDLSTAILSVIEKAPLGKVYNVAPNAPISIKSLVGIVAHKMKIRIDDLVVDVPDRVGQDSRYHLDSNAIKSDCGWKQKIMLGEGLNEMITWCQAFPELMSMYTGYEHRT